jgi:hypothetical protein
MANEKTVANTAPPQTGIMSVVAPLAGWLIPGLGHIIQRRWIRGLLVFLSVGAMFFSGVAMSGRTYGFNLGDLLQMLGFVGDFGNGLFYFLARSLDWGSTAITSAVVDYGTKYIVCAGLLNVIAAIDAHHIAIGKKS